MHLYNTEEGIVIAHDGRNSVVQAEWDTLINRNDLFAYLAQLQTDGRSISGSEFREIISTGLRPPVGSQEVWAAGVTYLRSRDARMEEAKDAGGGDFYQKVYNAQRPELFFKAVPHRVVTHGQQVYIRKDSSWNVPEPELTLYINSHGNTVAYTIGNDMSSRSIEGENPLYLPQAKVYDKSCSIGPCLWVRETPIPSETAINLLIKRGGEGVFSGSIQLNKIKRRFDELAGYLFSECTFRSGCFLMTGTGIVPADDFTLAVNDEISISIEGIGTLTNTVAERP